MQGLASFAGLILVEIGVIKFQLIFEDVGSGLLEASLVEVAEHLEFLCMDGGLLLVGTGHSSSS